MGSSPGLHGGGGGGGGGNGLILTDDLDNTGTIQGGNGGKGGDGGEDVFSKGGDGGGGGEGGVGAQFTNPAAVALTNSGIISGGNGGAGGSGINGSAAGAAGVGGAGVAGADLTIINSGTISGGMSGDTTPVQANAITFTGGTNVLELQSGSSISGNVVAGGSADTFRLGGATDSTFDVSKLGSQYQGFESLVKNGVSTWTLTNPATATAAWTIDAGTLSVNGSIVLVERRDGEQRRDAGRHGHGGRDDD